MYSITAFTYLVRVPRILARLLTGKSDTHFDDSTCNTERELAASQYSAGYGRSVSIPLSWSRTWPQSVFSHTGPDRCLSKGNTCGEMLETSSRLRMQLMLCNRTLSAGGDCTPFQMSLFSLPNLLKIHDYDSATEADIY